MKEEILTEWNPWWTENYESDFVDRGVCKAMEKWMARREILPITGPRRSGKTTVMYLTIKKLLRTVPRENILFIKCDDERVGEDGLIERAREKYLELFNPEGTIYMFLDEVQETGNWDKTVKRIYDLNENTKILLSGSRLLKRELSLSLAGRFVYFDVYPFSFKEFLKCVNVELRDKMQQLSNKDTIKYHLRGYIQWGGFPEIVLEGDREMKKELLKFYSDSILYRDVVTRTGIKRVEKVEQLKNYLLANISNLLNYNRIAKHLGISTDTVVSYVNAMENAYYMFPVPLFAYSLKKQQINPKKIYCIDTGIRNAVGFSFSSDIGRLYENIVFLHLKKRYDEIFYWKNGRGEVDFLVKEGTRIVQAIQVCYDTEDAWEREEISLLAALDEFELEEGLVVTEDTRDLKVVGGKRIRYLPLWEWLLEE